MRVRRPFTVQEAIGDLPREVVASGEVLPYPPKGTLSAFQKMMRLDCDGGPYLRRTKKDRCLGKEPVALHNHHTKEILARRRHLISLLKPGQKGDSLPTGVWNGRRPEKWRRLHPDQPSYTILAQMHRDLSEWVHPSLERWITVREAARLQSFHDGFVFKSSEWQQLKQIGNAVPPLLAYALAQMASALLAQIRPRRRSERLRLPAADLFQHIAAE
jgi:DNA (cytosine-5)-methyltransferase 1